MKAYAMAEAFHRMKRRFVARQALMLLLSLTILTACGLSEARIKRENDATAHYKFGVAYLAETPRAFQKAYIEFQKVIELDPKHRDAHYMIGHVHFQLQNLPEGLASFEEVLKIDPDYSDAHNYMGRIYAVQENFEKAIASYEMALKNKKYVTPETPYWNLALIYHRQKRYKYAVQALKNALRMNPALVSAHNLLGQVYSKMGETEKAISSYQTAIQVNPDDINAHYKLACIYKREGSSNLADREFNKAVLLFPLFKEEDDFRKCLNPVS